MTETKQTITNFLIHEIKENTQRNYNNISKYLLENNILDIFEVQDILTIIKEKDKVTKQNLFETFLLSNIIKFNKFEFFKKLLLENIYSKHNIHPYDLTIYKDEYGDDVINFLVEILHDKNISKDRWFLECYKSEKLVKLLYNKNSDFFENLDLHCMIELNNFQGIEIYLRLGLIKNIEKEKRYHKFQLGAK